MMPRRSVWAAFVLLVVLPCATHAEEAYYMLVFGYQRPVINQPKYTHSFATFVRARCEGERGDRTALDFFTISWLPQTLEVKVQHLLPECGINLDLYSSLRLGVENKTRISMWGPYQISRELYDRAVEQRAHLESGAVRYKAVDSGFPTARVSNCIHAVSDLANNTPRLRIISPGWGQAASYFIALKLRPWIIEPEKTHDWIMDALGLECYHLVRRDMGCNPTDPVLKKAIQELLHLDLTHYRRN